MPDVRLLDDGRPLLAASAAARERTRRTGRGEIGELRAGHTPAVTGEEMAELARVLRAKRPEIGFSAPQVYPDELVTNLLAGELDVGLARQLGATPGLTMSVVARQPLRVAVAAEHRLANRREIELSELADDTIVVWGHPGRSGYTDFFLEVCRRAGFEPRVDVSPQGTPPITTVIEPGRVAFVTAPPGRSGDGRAVVLDLRPALHVSLQAIWPEQGASPLVAEFLAAVAAAPVDL